MLHKLYKNTTSEALRGMIVQYQDVHDCHTRQRCFQTHKYTNSIVERSFLFEGLKLWNSLPLTLKEEA